MIARSLAALLLASVFFVSCEKNTASKIPQILLTTFHPEDSMIANIDTAFIVFSIIDGDADIGGDSISSIFLKDSRYESLGFIRTPFPDLDVSVEDPKKGLEGICLFYPNSQQQVPRPDTLHVANGDTLSYEMYITDRAGHESNHIITHSFIIRP